MTAAELQRLLRERYPVENERHEWKGWRGLKHNVSGAKGEDLLCYVSALANMDGGCVLIGVEDGSLAPVGLADPADYTPETLPYRLLGRCANLPSLGLHVEVLRADDTGAAVWVLHVPRHAPRRPVHAHDMAWQRDHDKLVPLREDRLAAILAEALAGEDWSAVVVEAASLTDLDPAALSLARAQYAAKHARSKWAAEVPGWSDSVFLDRARLTLQGGITRAALLLLGRTGSVPLLAPNPAEITWKLPAERAVQHFGPPFLLSTTALMRQIRNPIIKLVPESQLIPVQLPRYETRLVLEALHNCIAHQDYSRAERIVVEEWPARLCLINAGGFVDGQPEDYFQGLRTPSRYRNACLATAMDEIGMIDKAGFGISDMVRIQRERYLPLPDYVGSTAARTVFNVLGQSLSLDYSRLLMQQSDIDLATVLLLDHLQKGHDLTAEQRRQLRLRGLIEGRGARTTISAGVATATDRETEYVDASGLDTAHFRALVLKLLALGPQPRAKINRLLLDKLPATVVGDTRRRAYVKALLQELTRRGEIQNVGGATKAARWALVQR
ncbi:ATP-binding protein [Aquabacterium sp.]|uniref:ATP-binding protein n=1 Tax=Aquabacterium sp. TaxID=1872578 RepID=UPI002BB269BD|nr:ATP-binding protein [Aquabacterium sp.]HSW05460.1 ATP-binding protein [Aquabacterium sp.]